MIRTPALSAIVIVIALTLALAVSVSSITITSPEICLSNLECPRNTFCTTTDSSQLPLCAPRRSQNDACNNVGLGECKNGLTCIFDDTITNTGPTCRRRSPRGATCRLDATNPCVDPLICDRNTTTCQPFTDGFVGTPCEFDRHCQQNKGFYCQSRPGVCAPKRPPGGECDRAADNFECRGFCVTSSLDNGICVPASKEGDLCTSDRECDNPFVDTAFQGVDTLVCNIPTGIVGRCVRQSRLITRLGARCHTDHDRCDTRRALSCRPTRGGEHVCQHRTSRFDREIREYCEPRSRLSRCSWRDEKTECRLERAVPGQFSPFEPSPFFLCQRRSEKVARGGVCMAEHAACADDTECRKVPGVRPEPSEPFQRFPSPRVAFCLQIARKGEECGDVKDKFRIQCGDGLRCDRGTCMNAEGGEPPFDDTQTHAGIRAFCTDLPCAPGLVCDREVFDTKDRCLLPLRVVGKGVACTDRAVERRKCEDGLVCALDKDGTNIRRCRRPRKAGDYCLIDEVCEEGLVCPLVWTGNREQEERRCYDPKTTLKIGERCDPQANRSQPGCVVSEIPDESFPGGTVVHPMRCMRKTDGFACRVVVGLYDFCDEKKDVTCDSGLRCGNLGVCVPDER